MRKDLKNSSICSWDFNRQNSPNGISDHRQSRCPLIMKKTFFYRAAPLLLLAVAATLLVPLTAGAGVYERYGLGPRAIALGGAYTALSDDWTAPYYNPAGLAQARAIQTAVGFFTAFPDFEVRFNGYPNEELRQFPGDPDSSSSIFALDLGLVIPIERLGSRRLPIPINLGAVFSIPNFTTATVLLLPDRFPQQVLLDDRNIAASMNLGLATQITPAFSLGFGVTMTMQQSIDYLPGYSEQSLSVKTRTEVGAAAIKAGFLCRPAEPFSFGISYQGEMRSSSRIVEARVAVLNIRQHLQFLPTDRTERTYCSYFEPQHVSFGVSYRLTERILVAAGMTWYNWSSYVTTQDEEPPQPFDDVFVPHAGIEYRLTKTWTLRTGFSYEQSPVTDQPSGYNYLGNDRYIPSIGVGCRFHDPLHFFTNPIQVAFALQYHHLVSRTFAKEGRPRDPDISSKGWIITTGLSVSLTF